MAPMTIPVTTTKIMMRGSFDINCRIRSIVLRSVDCKFGIAMSNGTVIAINPMIGL